MYNTVINQGATWELIVTYNDPQGDPINITNYDAAMQLRTSPLARTAALTLTNDNGGIVINGAQGTVTITATATQTSGLIPQKYTYDLELYAPGGVVTRLIQGTIIVSAETTRI